MIVTRISLSTRSSKFDTPEFASQCLSSRSLALLIITRSPHHVNFITFEVELVYNNFWYKGPSGITTMQIFPNFFSAFLSNSTAFLAQQ